jgi:nicotinate-nucleotide pyrophosphorylase (carboxylating)
MTELSLAPLDPATLRRVVEAALDEDGARHDVTTQALVSADQQASAAMLIKAPGVLAGLPIATAAFASLDEGLHFEVRFSEGSSVSPGDAVARVSGRLAPILSAERVALNFVQRLSGIATATRQMVDAVAGLPVRIVDTRKTAPGLRALERYAVRAGGGENHRFNLADAVLIKDNHLAAARLRGWTIADVISTVEERVPDTLRIQIEVTSFDEAREAIAAGARLLLLDNMSVAETRRVVDVARARPGVVLEASGGITIDNVRAVAETGVDIISVGALTHSARALDISLELEVGR